MSDSKQRVNPIAEGRLVTDLDANGRNIRNLDAPVEAHDAATKEYVDQHAGGVASVNGKTGVVVLTGEDIRLNSGEGATATVADRVDEVDSIATNAANEINDHAGDRSNPHAVTADQVGALSVEDMDGDKSVSDRVVFQNAVDVAEELTVGGHKVALRSELDGKLDKTGGMVASLAIGTEAKNLVADHLGLAIRSGSVWEGEWAFPDQDGTFALTKDIKITATTTTALKDRDCAVVAFVSGMTITFAAATNGLRSFEVLITGCEAGGSINFPSVVYRGEADALTLEAGDNHLVFAEYKSGEFFVTRHVANTITIG